VSKDEPQLEVRAISYLLGILPKSPTLPIYPSSFPSA